MSKYPIVRLRRKRQNNWIRNLVSESCLNVNDLIWPLFVHDGNKNVDIKSMPDVKRYSNDGIFYACEKAVSLGIPLIALFPYTDPSKKDENGTESYNPDNLICSTTRKIKEKFPELGIMCDVALDPYTIHGHDGVLSKDGYILNDETVDILCKQSLVQAEAGCDVIAPSDMMDGRVRKIRETLDTNGFSNTLIMSYAAKYASNFYGPFRDAVGSSELSGQDKAKGFRDKRTYQLDFRNSDEALKEVELDIKEGADMVIVKPGLAYLDIIYKVKTAFNIPIFAYQVSGEYSMLMGAINDNLLSEKVIYESLIAFKRAGANGILTYFADKVAESIKN